MKRQQYTILADIAEILTFVFFAISFISCMAAAASPLFFPGPVFMAFIGAFFAGMTLAYISDVLSQWLHDLAYRQSGR